MTKFKFKSIGWWAHECNRRVKNRKMFEAFLENLRVQAAKPRVPTPAHWLAGAARYDAEHGTTYQRASEENPHDDHGFI